MLASMSSCIAIASASLALGMRLTLSKALLLGMVPPEGFTVSSPGQEAGRLALTGHGAMEPRVKAASDEARGPGVVPLRPDAQTGR